MAQSDEPVRLTVDQLKPASEVVGRAFQNDPLMKYVVPDDARRARLLPAFFGVALRYCLRYGEVYTTPTLAGAACWLPPGNTFPALSRLVRAALPDLMQVQHGLGLTGLSRFFATERYTDALHERTTPGPHWYLWVLGVDPAQHGHGIGGRLMQPGFTRANASGLTCYLETENEKNVPFYLKHGFQVVHEGEIPGSGVRVWAFLRDSHR